jgi:hypothetical protein
MKGPAKQITDAQIATIMTFVDMKKGCWRWKCRLRQTFVTFTE